MYKHRIIISYFIIGLMVAVSLPACKKIRELTRFTIRQETYATIPSSTLINLPINVATPDIQTNSAQEFQANNTDASLVRSAFMESLQINIQSPGSADFDFLRTIRIYLSADGLPEKRIAFLEEIPQTGLRSLTLTVDESVDLQEYVKKEKFALRVETINRELNSNQINLRINSAIKIEADIF